MAFTVSVPMHGDTPSTFRVYTQHGHDGDGTEVTCDPEGFSGVMFLSQEHNPRHPGQSRVHSIRLPARHHNGPLRDLAIDALAPVMLGRADRLAFSWTSGQVSEDERGSSLLVATRDGSLVSLRAQGNWAHRPGRGRTWTEVAAPAPIMRALWEDLLAWRAGASFLDLPVGRRGWWAGPARGTANGLPQTGSLHSLLTAPRVVA